MILNCSNLSKSFGDRLLFSGVSFSVEKGDILGLVGANGVGKTTLFQMITGQDPNYEGSIVLPGFCTLGYLEQHVCADSDRTAYEETLRVFDPLKEIERELEDIRLRLTEKADPELIERQERLLEEYKEKDGLTYVALTHSVLKGLGFTDEEQDLPVKSLSGGQKSKIGLAKLLLQKPDLMLLDEPTNHLDIDSVAWLEKFIVGSHITTMVISHDRYFLDRICNKIAEITTYKIYLTEGNYTRHMDLKAERDLAEERHYTNVMNEVHRIEGIIEQQRRWNREKNIKTAESKEKQIARMVKGLEKPEVENFDFSFHFTPNTVSGEEVLEVRDAAMAFPGKQLYEHVSFEVKRGECVFVIGENGIGKTTLIKQILKKSRGIKFGIGVTTGYFDQHQMNLNQANTALEEIHNAYPRMGDTDVRSALALFGFRQDKVFEPISTLSGGERAKISLCKLMLQKCNFLVLDEPTNHLDIYSMAALEEALSEYEGTLLIISHDRYFINKLADKIVLLKPDGSTTYTGNYDEYLAALEREQQGQPKETAPRKELGTGGKSYLDQKRLRSERTKARTALRNKETEIQKLEAQIEDLNGMLNDPAKATDFEYITKTSEELAKANGLLEAALEDWETLAERVSEYEED